ncbi:MAG: DNA repair protein RadA, partial [Proteobacteria bacterium]
MAKAPKSKTVYVCQNCGAQRSRWEGRCTDCDSWNTFVEETFQAETPVSSRQRGWSTSGAGSSSDMAGERGGSGPQVITLDQPVREVQIGRASTGYKELDRVLGGGLVKGSFVLLGGDPGIGKSTLLLQMAGGLAARKRPEDEGQVVLYVSGEESVAQSALRAQRLGVTTAKV